MPRGKDSVLTRFGVDLGDLLFGELEERIFFTNLAIE
jgi:hypothetical protein